MAIVKVRIGCDNCHNRTIDIAGTTHNFGAVLQEIQRNGWKVVCEKLETRHYCPDCEVIEF